MCLTCSRRSLNQHDFVLRHFYDLLEHTCLTFVEFGMVLDKIVVHLMHLLLEIKLIFLWQS